MQPPFIVRAACAPRFTFVGAGGMLFGHGFRHMFSALDGVIFSWRIGRAVRFPSCAYTDAIPGVGSLVGGEFSQSLEARLLVSVLRWVGGYWFSLLHIVLLMNSHVVLFYLFQL